MPTELGKAYVQIIPSADGISGSIENVLAPEAESAGEKAGQTISSKIGAALGAAGPALTKGVTAPLTAVGGASIKAFSSVHGGLETIIQKTGASGEALDSMQSIMNDIATSMPSDFNTIGAAVGEVNTRFGSTGEELQELSEKFIKFADLNGTDVSNSIDTVQAAMAAFGLKTSDTGAFLDTLNKAGQDTGVSVDQLASDLMTNAAALQAMGYNASDSAMFIANLNKNGIDSSAVMTGMKRAFATATADGKTMSEAMGELQTAMQNADTDTEAYQSALELFGNRAGPALAAAVQDGRLSFEQLGTSIEDNVGNIDTTFNETLTPMDDFKTTMNSLAVTGAQIGNTLLTIVKPALEQLNTVLQKISDKWNELSPETQDMIVKIALVAAALGPVIGIITKIIGVVQMVGTVISVVGAGPLALIVAAIAAVIAIIVVCITHWDQIKATMLSVAASVKSAVVTAWESMKSAVSKAVTTVVTTVTTVWGKLKSTASTIWTAIKTAVTNPVQTLKSALTTAWNAIRNVATRVWTNLKSKATSAWNSIKTAALKPITTLKTNLSTTWESIKSKAGTAFEAVKKKITEPIEKAKTTVKNALEKIKGFFPVSVGKIFSNMKLPHFKVSGGQPPWGIMGQGTKPTISVDWYKKAMNQPYVFDSPTLFGAGEAGDEMMYGRTNLMNDIREAVSGQGTNNVYNINITVDGAEQPEDYARRLARQLQMELRMA